MSTHRQELATRSFNFVPTTLKEAQEYATIFASSGLCPESYRGRPNDILIVWQMGKELGLEKMQALRTLGCINGMPFAYGDGLLALVKRHPQFEDMHESMEGEGQTMAAVCTIKRKGKDPVTQRFSVEDARLAGLWGKKGTWQMYPKRMLQHRARGFAVKDAFPDAIFGLMSEDEVRGIVDSTPVVETAPIKAKGMASLEAALGIAEPEAIEGEIVEAMPEESPLDQLKRLIVETKTSDEAVSAWLKKENVAILDELTPERVQKAIVFLQTKESK